MRAITFGLTFGFAYCLIGSGVWYLEFLGYINAALFTMIATVHVDESYAEGF